MTRLTSQRRIRIIDIHSIRRIGDPACYRVYPTLEECEAIGGVRGAEDGVVELKFEESVAVGVGCCCVGDGGDV